jgi:hypothetical protein
MLFSETIRRLRAQRPQLGVLGLEAVDLVTSPMDSSALVKLPIGAPGLHVLIHDFVAHGIP